jgi:hypothetical protein
MVRVAFGFLGLRSWISLEVQAVQLAEKLVTRPVLCALFIVMVERHFLMGRTVLQTYAAGLICSFPPKHELPLICCPL